MENIALHLLCESLTQRKMLRGTLPKQDCLIRTLRQVDGMEIFSSMQEYMDDFHWHSHARKPNEIYSP